MRKCVLCDVCVVLHSILIVSKFHAIILYIIEKKKNTSDNNILNRITTKQQRGIRKGWNDKYIGTGIVFVYLGKVYILF